MTLKTQKIIMYIPIVQIITFFCWLMYYYKKNLKKSDFFKTLFLIIGWVVVITIPRIILNAIFKNETLDNIVFYIFLYPTLFGISYIAVADQEKHENG